MLSTLLVSMMLLGSPSFDMATDAPTISRHNGGIVEHVVHSSPVIETGKASSITSADTAAHTAKCPVGWTDTAGVCLPS